MELFYFAINLSLFAVVLVLAGITFAIRKVYQDLSELTKTTKSIAESLSKIENTLRDISQQAKN